MHDIARQSLWGVLLATQLERTQGTISITSVRLTSTHTKFIGVAVLKAVVASFTAMYAAVLHPPLLPPI
jgi:hypothetical protein